MVSSAQRTWVRRVQEAYAVSERTACDAGCVARSSVRYASIAAPHEPLRQRLRELAQTPRDVLVSTPPHAALPRRLARESQTRPSALSRRRTHAAAQTAETAQQRGSLVVRVQPGDANERWAMDFIHDQRADGTAFRMLSIVDLSTRKYVGLVPAIRLRADDIVATLSRLRDECGIPGVIQCDNGTEFTSVALDHWCYWNQVRVKLSRPGKPTDNAAIESFHKSSRRECLTQHYFMGMSEAQHQIERYRFEHNNDRPHSSLGNVPPAHFRDTVATTASLSSTA